MTKNKTASALSRVDEEDAVRILGDAIGYGQLMQLAEQIWKAKDKKGGNQTVGPCSVFMVPCKHWVKDENGHCNICCGSGRVTQGVEAIASTLGTKLQEEAIQKGTGHE